MTNKLSFEIEVIDTGKIKVKQFADTTKKAVEDISKSTENLARASSELQDQYTKLISAFGTKKAFEELGSSVKKAEASVAGLGQVIAKIITELAKWTGLYKFFEEGHSFIKELTTSTRQFDEEMKKIDDRLAKLRTPAKVLAFLQEEQAAARDLAEGLKSADTLLEAYINTMKDLGLQGKISSKEYSILLDNIRWLAEAIGQGERRLEVHNRAIVEAAEKYQDFMGLFEEFYQKLEERETLREQSLMLQEQIRAEEVVTQAFYDSAQALAQLEDRYGSNLPGMIEFSNVSGLINQNYEGFAELSANVSDGLRGQGEAIEALDQKQKEWNKTNLRSINIFAAMFDMLGALSNLMTQFGISIGGGVQRFLGSISAIRQLTTAIGQIRQAGAGGILEFLGLRAPGQGGTVAGGGAITSLLGRILPGAIGGSLGGLLSNSLFGNLSAPARTGLGAGMGALGGGMASWMLGGSFFGPVGLIVGGIIGGLMSLFGGGRQRPSERLVASQQGGSFMELLRDRMYGPAASQLRSFLGFENFGEPESRLYAPGLRERGEAFAGTLATGRIDRSAAQAYVAELRELSARLRAADIEMSENTIKLVNTITDMAESVGETIGESQQQLEGVMQNLIALERQITGAILQMHPPTIGARVEAFGQSMHILRDAWANPDLQPAEREQLLRRAFEQTTQSAGDLVAELQNMARENQAAARTIEGLSRDIYNLRREEEERRRGVQRAIFEAGLVGRVTPDEANRLRRQYLIEEALRIKTVLESGQVRGAERIGLAEQGQSIAEEILRLYGQDELVSLEELANVQRDVITALQFIDQQIATGYQEQIDPLQEQLTTQRDILTVNQAILQANFGVQTAAEAIELVQNTAVGYLEAIRDNVISFGASIFQQLAPLLGTDSPMYREMALQSGFIQIGNNLIDSGLQNLRRPMEAMQAELPNIPENLADYLSEPIAALRKSIESISSDVAQAYKFTIEGGAPAALATAIEAGAISEQAAQGMTFRDYMKLGQTATAVSFGAPVEYPGMIPPDIYNLPASQLRDMLLQNWAAVIMGREPPYDANVIWRAHQAWIAGGGIPIEGYGGILPVLQTGGRIVRTGVAVVEEGETVVPAGGARESIIDLELHLHQTIDGASEETVIRKVIPIIYRESRDGRDVVHVNGMVNV